MKTLIDTINEATIERINVVCVKDLETKHRKFKKGDVEEATRINQNWWLIDSIGIGEKQFKTYFKKNPTTK